MRTPWTLSNLEAAIFVVFVVLVAGAGTMATAIQ
jgi:hypothetical protein